MSNATLPVGSQEFAHAVEAMLYHIFIDWFFVIAGAIPEFAICIFLFSESVNLVNFVFFEIDRLSEL